jgi:hypothetical protein
MIICDFQDDSDGLLRCKSKATRFKLQCIHPPSPKYNQQGGEFGSYLGPEPAPNNFSYNPKDVPVIIAILPERETIRSMQNSIS